MSVIGPRARCVSRIDAALKAFHSNTTNLHMIAQVLQTMEGRSTSVDVMAIFSSKHGLCDMCHTTIPYQLRALGCAAALAAPRGPGSGWRPRHRLVKCRRKQVVRHDAAIHQQTSIHQIQTHQGRRSRA